MPLNLLQVQNATKSFGSRQLFSKANLSINEDEHIGVIGPNGAGKTTLFKLIAGELDLDEGEIVRSRQLSLGYLKQHDDWKPGETLESYIEKDAKMPIWELKQLAVGLGLREEIYSKEISSLSGGYRMRAKLLYLLGQQPNLMMLDEPTNYLDLETLLVLEQFLQNYQGAFLLISHDREFLRRTTDHILEIESGEFTKYAGNIDDYFEQKELLRSQLEKRAMAIEEKKRTILEFAAKFGAKASKARQAQSRLRSMSKMESIELKSLPIAAKIRIPQPHRTGRMAMELKQATLGYPQKQVLQQVSLQIESGSHIGIVGLNGAGKSTLLKSLAKEIPSLGGHVEHGYGSSVGYYAQHVHERLNPSHTVLEALTYSAPPDIKRQEILDLAGSLLFSGDDSKKKISVLSGGEKARVALGQILLKRASILLLDEPTNHLDFFTVEALTQALKEYSGTVLLVSHDRGFVQRVATKIFEVHRGRVRVYPGSYEDYVWSLQNGSWQDAEEEWGAQSPVPANAPKPAAPSPEPLRTAAEDIFRRARKKELEAERRVLDKQFNELDRKIKILETRLSELSVELSKPSSISSSDVSAKISHEMGIVQKKIHELEAEHLKILESRENLNREIAEL